MPITITMKQTRQGDAGAVLLAGQTYSVRNELAAQFVGQGYATDDNLSLNHAGPIETVARLVTPTQLTALAVAGTPVPVGTLLADPITRLLYGQSDGVGSYRPIASNSGGSGEGSGGSDRTALTVEADPVNGGQRTRIETLDGVPHTYNYDAQGRLILDSWAAGGLSRSVEYSTVPGFGLPSGNIFVDGGAIRVPSAAMPALKTALVSQGTAVAARFFVPELQASFQWDHVDLRFRPANAGGVALFTAALISFANPAAAEQTGASFAWPGWLRGKGGRLTVNVRWDTPNAAIVKTTRVKFNGSDIRNTSTGATALYVQHEAVADCVSDADVVRPATGAVMGSTGDAVSTTAPTQTTYTANSDITVAVTLTYSSDPGAITARLIQLRATYS